MRIVTLKRRAEFVRIRGGARWSTATLVLEAKLRLQIRENEDPLVYDPRFGFTVTKKIGGAVVRNRVRRRLRAAVGALPPDLARPGHDYVLIARAGAVTSSFAHLQRDLVAAFARVHRTQSSPLVTDPHSAAGRRNPRSASARGKTS
jgi:ribonuclease P protein component